VGRNHGELSGLNKLTANVINGVATKNIFVATTTATATATSTHENVKPRGRDAWSPHPPGNMHRESAEANGKRRGGKNVLRPSTVREIRVGVRRFTKANGGDDIRDMRVIIGRPVERRLRFVIAFPGAAAALVLSVRTILV
jgi:hypothetical protein